MTFYDDATGERTELSAATYANWVAKTANLLSEEMMLEPGDAISLELEPHWLGTVFAGAVSAAGLTRSDRAEARIVGPGQLPALAASAPAPGTVLACSLTPFATRFTEPLPAGVLDHGTLWAGQSDFFAPVASLDLGAVEPDDRRVITDLDPLGDHGNALLAALIAGAGSLVLVAHPDEKRWPAHSQSERATGSLRAQPMN